MIVSNWLIAVRRVCFGLRIRVALQFTFRLRFGPTVAFFSISSRALAFHSLQPRSIGKVYISRVGVRHAMQGDGS